MAQPPTIDMDDMHSKVFVTIGGYKSSFIEINRCLRHKMRHKVEEMKLW